MKNTDIIVAAILANCSDLSSMPTEDLIAVKNEWIAQLQYGALIDEKLCQAANFAMAELDKRVQ